MLRNTCILTFLQHYLQQPSHGNDLGARRDMNGSKICDVMCVCVCVCVCVKSYPAIRKRRSRHYQQHGP